MNDIIQFLLNPQFTGWLLFMKIMFLLISLFFICFIIYALTTTKWLQRLLIWDMREYLTYRHYGVVSVKKKWENIKKRFNLGFEPEVKLSLIEADNLLNDTLKTMGYAGNTLGEKLDKLSIEILSNLEEVRAVHGIRSDIIHDPAYRLSVEKAEKAIEVYEKSFVELQAL